MHIKTFRIQKKHLVVITILAILLGGIYNVQQQKRAAHLAEIARQNLIIQDELARNAIPHVNTLVIPKLNVTAEISEGEYEGDRTYLRTWRRTHTNTPDRGGNTVIVGHRYRDKPEYPLYNIDQFAAGDIITLYWEGVQYDYAVTDTFAVGLYDITVEDPTDEDILTLYACDWSGKNRLIVRAALQ